MVSADRRQALRRALSRYLRANAHACDTADGIVRWWMPLGSDVSETEISPLLDELHEKGLITRVSTLEGKWRYRRASIDAASDFALEQMTMESNGSH